jgi:hypothetical protein
MKRLRLLALFLFSFLGTHSVEAGLTPPGSPASPNALPPLCSPLYQLQHPEECPTAGPGGYAQQLVAAGLPYRLPSLDLKPVYPYHNLTPDAYGQVITDTPGVYRHPLEALAGLPPLYRYDKGFVFVSLRNEVTFSGTTFYEINPGEFMFGRDLKEYHPSGFAGIHFASPPASPVGWVIENAQLSAAPGQPPDSSMPWAGRYQPVTIFEVQRAGEWNWYLIGPGQWIEQRLVAVVQPAPPPGSSGNVIAVDTYEQTLGVYRNGGLIFASLISSGSRVFPTRPGTFQIRVKLTHGKMTGAYLDDRRDYYYLEDVPWIMYYDDQRALHGSYWHDHYGLRGSHGCVNLSPIDARWLYDFANVGDTVVVFSSSS